MWNQLSCRQLLVRREEKKGSNLGPVLKSFLDGPVFFVTDIPVQPVDEQPQFSGLYHLVVATVLTAEKSKHQGHLSIITILPSLVEYCFKPYNTYTEKHFTDIQIPVCGYECDLREWLV